MTENITQFRTATNPDDVLEQAKGQFSDVLVLGWNHQGHLGVRASQTITAKDVLWLVETFKLRLIEGYFTTD